MKSCTYKLALKYACTYIKTRYTFHIFQLSEEVDKPELLAYIKRPDINLLIIY